MIMDHKRTVRKKLLPIFYFDGMIFFLNINLQPDHAMIVNPAPSLNMETLLP
jgi:hypothetical protein